MAFAPPPNTAAQGTSRHPAGWVRPAALAKPVGRSILLSQPAGPSGCCRGGSGGPPSWLDWSCGLAVSGAGCVATTSWTGASTFVERHKDRPSPVVGWCGHAPPVLLVLHACLLALAGGLGLLPEKAGGCLLLAPWRLAGGAALILCQTWLAFPVVLAFLLGFRGADPWARPTGEGCRWLALWDWSGGRPLCCGLAFDTVYAWPIGAMMPPWPAQQVRSASGCGPAGQLAISLRPDGTVSGPLAALLAGGVWPSGALGPGGDRMPQSARFVAGQPCAGLFGRHSTASSARWPVWWPCCLDGPHERLPWAPRQAVSVAAAFAARCAGGLVAASSALGGPCGWRQGEWRA